MSAWTALMYSSRVTLLSSVLMELLAATDGSRAVAEAGAERQRVPDRHIDLGPAVELARGFVRDGAVPSIVFGVADSRGLWSMHALGGDARAGTDSIYFLASLTKAIVATAVMQYVDEGRWDLHAPLARYLPDFTGSGREAVTAWHILTHTSGLADTAPEVLRRERPTYGRLLASCMARVPRWPPGTRYEYNSAVWALLAETMATLSGMPFDQALRTRLTEPLGMVDTSFDPRRSRSRVQPVSGLAMRNRLVGEVLMRFLARARLAGGGMFGTLPDLLRFGRSLAGPPGTPAGTPDEGSGPGPRAIVSEAAIVAMATPQIEGIPHIAEDGSVSYVSQGIGWRTPGPGWPQRSGVLTHGGISGSRLWVDRQAGLAFALLTNQWHAPEEPTLAILDAVYAAFG